jgi:uncharacterized RDD family membrane protein YckC
MAACKRCGNELPPGALTCPTCPTRAVANPWTPPVQPAPPIPPAYAAANSPFVAQPYPTPQYASSSTWINQAYGGSPTDSLRKASFWIRLVAWLIDVFIVGVGGWILIAIIKDVVPPDESGLFILIVGVCQWLYWIFLWSDMIGNGQTIGMSLFHLRILRKRTGQPISVLRAVGRHIMLVGFWWLGWVAWTNESKQAMHDLICNTVVVDES